MIGAPALIETVLQNLIDNAVSFSPMSGTIEVTLQRRSTVVELSVADQGPGVAPDALERIFDRSVSFRESQGASAEGGRAGAVPRGPANFGLGAVDRLSQCRGHGRRRRRRESGRRRLPRGGGVTADGVIEVQTLSCDAFAQSGSSKGAVPVRGFG